MDLSRNDLLGLTGLLGLPCLNSALLDRRVAMRQAAFVGGAEISAKHGAYLPLDAVAMTLVDTFAGNMGLDRAADFVRVNSDLWFHAVVSAEWEEPGPYYFAALMQMRGARKKAVTVGQEGTLEQIAAVCRVRFPAATIMAVNIDEVLSEIHTRARDLDLGLPEKFTAKPGTPAYQQMVADIKDYRAQAAARLKSKGRRRVVFRPTSLSQ
jgi:hypothetical protein